MIFIILEWVCIAFLGASLGIVLSLLWKEMSTSPTDSRPSFLSTHQHLVHRWGPFMGITESGAFVAILILTLSFEGHWILFLLSALAWVCIAAMIGIWAVRIYPINKRIDLWETDAMPMDWQRVRRRWRRLHSERAAIAIVGMVALIATVSMI